jgi:hypothetical protein
VTEHGIAAVRAAVDGVADEALLAEGTIFGAVAFAEGERDSTILARGAAAEWNRSVVATTLVRSAGEGGIAVGTRHVPWAVIAGSRAVVVELASIGAAVVRLDVTVVTGLASLDEPVAASGIDGSLAGAAQSAEHENK